MKSKNKKTILCIAGFVLLTLLVIWSWREIEEPEVIINQEEYRIEMLAILDDSMLIAYPVGRWTIEWWPRVEIAPGVEVFYDRLTLYTHVLSFRHNPDGIASLEDIISLYNSYDEELDRRLRNLHAWLGHGGETCVNEYLRGIGRAFVLYTQQFGAFNGKEDFTEMRVEDKIELERFIRSNRSFMPREIYFKELWDMNIIDSNERERLAAAAAARER